MSSGPHWAPCWVWGLLRNSTFIQPTTNYKFTWASWVLVGSSSPPSPSWLPLDTHQTSPACPRSPKSRGNASRKGGRCLHQHKLQSACQELTEPGPCCVLYPSVVISSVLQMWKRELREVQGACPVEARGPKARCYPLNCVPSEKIR